MKFTPKKSEIEIHSKKSEIEIHSKKIGIHSKKSENSLFNECLQWSLFFKSDHCRHSIKSETLIFWGEFHSSRSEFHYSWSELTL